LDEEVTMQQESSEEEREEEHTYQEAGISIATVKRKGKHQV
jgi:hypothetical protein